MSGRITSPTSGRAARVDDAAAASALMITATAIVFVAGALLATGRPCLPGQIPAGAWPFLAAIGFAGTFLAIQTFYAGSRRIGAAQAALVSTVEPLIIVTLAWLALHRPSPDPALRPAGPIIVGVLIAQTAELGPCAARRSRRRRGGRADDAVVRRRRRQVLEHVEEPLPVAGVADDVPGRAHGRNHARTCSWVRP